MLKLPLHCYDEAGNILPPKWFYWLALLACVDYVTLIFALASMKHTTELLTLFYPERALLFINLAASLPVVFTLIGVSQRERLWKRDYRAWMRVIRPVMLTGFIAIAIVQLHSLHSQNWQFHAYSATKLFLALIGFYATSKSRHLNWMLQDWQQHAAKPKDESEEKTND